MNRKDRGVFVQKRSNQRLELIVRRALERHENQVGGRHFSRVVVDMKLVRLKTKITGTTSYRQSLASNRLVVGTQKKVHVVPVLGEACAIVAAYGASPDDGDFGAIVRHGS